MTIPQTIIAYAAWYNGRKERPGNSGFYDANFEKEMLSAGWYKGAPWCMFFVIMIWKKVFKKDILILAAIINCFNGSAKQTADRTVKAGILETGQEPEEGAICIFLHGHGPSGHAAVVREVSKKTNTMFNIEANTNISGSREGEIVDARKARTIKRDFQPNGLNVYLYIYPRLKKQN